MFPLAEADACTPCQGVTLLYEPSICTRSVQMDLLHSQVFQPFPTPGSGTLWVAGESLRDRRVSRLPRWTVCPTRSPSLGPNRSTCCGDCSWSGPLVTPPGRCHRGPLTNSAGRIPPYCVCSGGADTVTGGAPKPLRLGPFPAFPVGPLRPAPPSAVWFVVVGFPSLLGGVGSWWWGGSSSPFLAELLVCVSRPPLVAIRRRWRRVVPRHSWLRVLHVASRHSWLRSSGVGRGVGLRHSWLRSAGLRGVVPRFRLWVLGGPSLATPG